MLDRRNKKPIRCRTVNKDTDHKIQFSGEVGKFNIGSVVNPQEYINSFNMLCGYFSRTKHESEAQLGWNLKIKDLNLIQFPKLKDGFFEKIFELHPPKEETALKKEKLEEAKQIKENANRAKALQREQEAQMLESNNARSQRSIRNLDEADLVHPGINIHDRKNAHVNRILLSLGPRVYTASATVARPTIKTSQSSKPIRNLQSKTSNGFFESKSPGMKKGRKMNTKASIISEFSETDRKSKIGREKKWYNNTESNFEYKKGKNVLTDDNIFNYNAYFKKRYFNKGLRLELSDTTKNKITHFHRKLHEAKSKH